MDSGVRCCCKRTSSLDIKVAIYNPPPHKTNTNKLIDEKFEELIFIQYLALNLTVILNITRPGTRNSLRLFLPSFTEEDSSSSLLLDLSLHHLSIDLSGVLLISPQSLLVISFPDRIGKKETVYLGMFKAKILVLGPCEVFCFHSDNKCICLML